MSSTTEPASRRQGGNSVPHALVAVAAYKWLALSSSPSSPASSAAANANAVTGTSPSAYFGESVTARARSYIWVGVSSVRTGLYVHALGLLDGYYLRRSFREWARLAKTRNDERLAGVARLWRRWRLFAIANGRAYRKILSLLTNANANLAAKVLKEWNNAARACRHERTRTQPLALAHSLSRWRVNIDKSYARYTLFNININPDIVVERHAFKRWRRRASAHARFRGAYVCLRDSVWSKIQTSAFGMWLVTFCRASRLRRLERRVSGKRARDVLVWMWVCWRQQQGLSLVLALDLPRGLEKSVLGADVRLGLGFGLDEMSSDSGRHNSESRRVIRTGWQLKIAHRLWSVLMTSWARRAKRMAWLGWKRLHALKCLCVCVQSLYRGRRARSLALTNTPSPPVPSDDFVRVSAYLSWFRGISAALVWAVRTRLLRLGFSLFTRHHSVVEAACIRVAKRRFFRLALRKLVGRVTLSQERARAERKGGHLYKRHNYQKLLRKLKSNALHRVASRAAADWHRAMCARKAIAAFETRVAVAERAVANSELVMQFTRARLVHALSRLALYKRWTRYNKRVTRRSHRHSLRRRLRQWRANVVSRKIRAVCTKRGLATFLAKVVKRMRKRTEVSLALATLSWGFFAEHRFEIMLSRWKDRHAFQAQAFSFVVASTRRYQFRRLANAVNVLICNARRCARARSRRTKLGATIKRMFLRLGLVRLRRKLLLRRTEKVADSGAPSLLASHGFFSSASHVYVPVSVTARGSLHIRHNLDVIASRGGAPLRRMPMDDGMGWQAPSPLVVVSRMSALFCLALRKLIANCRRHEARRATLALMQTRMHQWRLRRGLRKLVQMTYIRSLSRAFLATSRMRARMMICLRKLASAARASRFKLANSCVGFQELYLQSARHHDEDLLRKAVGIWSGICEAKRQVHRCGRRFRLSPALFAWLHLTAEAILSRKVLKDYEKRTCWKVVLAWRLVIEISQRLCLQSERLRRKVDAGIKLKVLASWLKAVDDKRAMERYRKIEELAVKMTLARTLDKWKSAMSVKIEREARAVHDALDRWKAFKRKRAAMRLTVELGAVYYQRRWLRRLRNHTRELQEIREKGSVVEALLLLSKARKMLRSWLARIIDRLANSASVQERMGARGNSLRVGGSFNLTNFAIDNRFWRRASVHSLKWWQQWTKRRLLSRIDAIFSTIKHHATNTRLLRLALIARLTHTFTRDRYRFVFDCLTSHASSQRHQRTASRYLLLDRKNRLLKSLLTLTRTRQARRDALIKLASGLRRRCLALSLKYWRIVSGPRFRVGARVLLGLVFSRWERNVRAIRCRRGLVSRSALSAWRGSVKHKFVSQLCTSRGRHHLALVVTKLKQRQAVALRQAFESLRRHAEY